MYINRKNITLYFIQTYVIQYYRTFNSNSLKTDKKISPSHSNKIVCIISNIKVILFVFKEKKENYQQCISLITIVKNYFFFKLFLQHV